MPKAKFTPGPWGYDATDGIVFREDGKPLLSAIPTGTPYQRGANGQLAAAAPDLYEALQGLCEYYGIPEASAASTDGAVWSSACRALAKARGEVINAR